MAKGFSMSGDNWCWFDYWQLHPDLLLEENSLRLFNHTRCQIGKRLEQITTVESLSINSCGYSEDWSYKENRATGDKAIYKAITGATKYAVREMFALASTDDPEKDEIRPSKSKPRTISQAQVNRLYTLATEEVGLSKERAKEVLQSCGYNSAKNIIVEDYERVVKVFQELGRAEGAKKNEYTTV